MSQFNIPQGKEIPYFDHGKNLGETIRNSSSRRKMNPLVFTFRKMRNIILNRIAYLSPFNSVRVKCHRKRGVNIGRNVYIGQFCNIDNAYPEFIFIEDNVSLAGEVTILAHANPYPHFKGIVDAKVDPVVVENGSWISVKCVLLPGARIGRNTIVSAGSVVNKKLPANCICVGNPAKRIYDFNETLKEAE